MRDGIVIAAPCKINTHLRVLDRRSDGFHDLESVFQTLSFGDELRIESLKERFACDVQMDGSVPPERNIVHKAVMAFRRALPSFEMGLRVEVVKRVPFGAGLGGGSSDAASTLMALNRLSGGALSGAALAEIAAGLGSDVPFFLYGGAAYVAGRGEKVRPLERIAPYAAVLVNPGFESDTGKAFSLLDAARASGRVESSRSIDPADLERAAADASLDWPFFNDFLPVLMETSPAYSAMIDDLRGCGAAYAGLSGSGATCFGVFSSPEDAESAVRSLRSRWPFAEKAIPLARSGKPVLE